MKAKYLLPCSCGRKIPIQTTQAGQEIRCQCGAALEVPAMRGLAQLERASPKLAKERPMSAQGAPATSPPIQTAEPSSTPSTPIWGTRQRLILIGAVIAVLGLGMATLFQVAKPRLIDAEQLSPIDTWRLWRDLRHGIEQRPPWEQFYLDTLASHYRWMIVSCVIAVVGVLVMGSSVLAPGRRRSRGARRPMPKARDPGREPGS